VIVYRVCNSKYATNISGESARRQTNNRWNSLGTPMLYTSDSPALCAVEIHQYIPPSFQPKNYSILEIKLPDCKILTLGKEFFANEYWIVNKNITQSMGDQFVKQNEYLVMKVPSSMIVACYNFLVNPYHKNFNEVKIVNTLKFPIEGKLFRK